MQALGDRPEDRAAQQVRRRPGEPPTRRSPNSARPPDRAGEHDQRSATDASARSASSSCRRRGDRAATTSTRRSRPTRSRNRIERQRLQPQAGGRCRRIASSTSRRPGSGPERAATTAVVLVSDAERARMRQDQPKWQEELATPDVEAGQRSHQQARRSFRRSATSTRRSPATRSCDALIAAGAVDRW